MNPGSCKVPFGSVAAPQHDISSMAASGGKAVPQRRNFDSEILNVCFSRKRTFRLRESYQNQGQLTAKSGHCDESVFSDFRKRFAGPLSGLPNVRVRVVSADDFKESFTLAGLSGFLACADGSKTRIVI